MLLKREYIERNGKNLGATDKGIHLIEVVHPEVKSPAMTGQWEAYLKRIERGEAQLDPFLHGIEEYVREVVGKVGALPAAPKSGPAGTGGNGVFSGDRAPLPENVPVASGERTVAGVAAPAFGFASFRANQEEVCRAVVEGRDVLLVMPTGAGKSLCYQLPGIARGGTTLVISPLIALMEDQVAKLRELGFAVDCIHSGRDRAASRQVCIDYLNGRLQFLFIAPERLRVGGFPEMLARRKPSLIAIDEAHCISQWGHDFRPDYRLLGQYLPTLRPAPVIALTATATRIVQHDIREQFGLESPPVSSTDSAVAISRLRPSKSRRRSGPDWRSNNSIPGVGPRSSTLPRRKQAESLAAMRRSISHGRVSCGPGRGAPQAGPGEVSGRQNRSHGCHDCVRDGNR